VSNCYSTADVFGFQDVGGLIGINSIFSLLLGTTNIFNCYATGNVKANTNVGGLVGLTGDATISNCFSRGSVTGMSYTGGFVGSSGASILACYSSGDVAGDTLTGGFAGNLNDGEFSSCFWDNDVCPDVNGVGSIDDPKVIGKTTFEMQVMNTFKDAGWDFVGETVNGPNDIWDICEGMNYPKHVWSIPAGDLVCPDGVNFIDYSYLVDGWGLVDPVRDLDGSGVVDANDCLIFCDDWLEGF
jgi:hypothetical protein